MLNPEKTPEQISDGLIAYLRVELNDAMIGYATPVIQMQGGYETYAYRFKLSGVHKALSHPLVLRLYPQFYGPDRAVRESTIQNILADQGYPVPRVYLTCTDMSILGGAFFIMQYLPGETMLTAPVETVPDMLGTTHASLHNIDPAPLIRSLQERGCDDHGYRLGRRLDWLHERASRYPWLREGMHWLMQNRPPEPARLSICHGDFHPLNVLVKDGQVTGVLDWPGFMIADPVLDVAYTMVLITIPAKHQYPEVACEQLAQVYLDAYCTTRPLDLTYLDYYRVMRCVTAFVNGADGQDVWQHPLIVQDLAAYIQKTTGIRILPPNQTP
jgi:aminoglycoside phosphotransferase (APT) family kinase protein